MILSQSFCLQNIKKVKYANAHYFYKLLFFKNHSNLKNHTKNDSIGILTELLLFSATSILRLQHWTAVTSSNERVETKSCQQMHK